MSIESTTLYSATFPAYDLIWVSPSWGKESSIALKLAREKNSKDAIITYLSSSKGAVNIGYNPVAD
jgi:hypothetical protein